MTGAQPVDLATAEIEARIALAQRGADETYQRLDTAVNRDSALANLSSYWATVSRWNLHLGRRGEGMAALQEAATWTVEYAEFMARSRLKAAELRSALVAVLYAREQGLERRVLDLPVHTDDGSLTRLGQGYVEALRALVLGDDRAARAAAEAMEAIGDERAVKDRSYPRLGPTVRALLDSNAGALRAELDAVCAQHVAYGTKGHLRGSEAAMSCTPAVILSLLARRRGVAADVDDHFHRVRLRFLVTHLREFEGRNVYRERFEIAADIAPVSVLIGDDILGPPNETAV